MLTKIKFILENYAFTSTIKPITWSLQLITGRWFPFFLIDILKAEQTFNTVHRLIHPSGRITPRRLKEKYIWPKILKGTITWFRECIPCQRVKMSRYIKLSAIRRDIPDKRFNHIYVHIIYLLKIKEYKYLLWVKVRVLRICAVRERDCVRACRWLVIAASVRQITTDDRVVDVREDTQCVAISEQRCVTSSRTFVFVKLLCSLIINVFIFYATHCLTITDRFSRFPVAVPPKDMEAEAVVLALFKGWITLFRTLLTIATA